MKNIARTLGMSYPHEFKQESSCMTLYSQVSQQVLPKANYTLRWCLGHQVVPRCPILPLSRRWAYTPRFSECKRPQLVHEKPRRRPIVERSSRWKPLDHQIFGTVVDPFLLCSRWHTKVWCKREVVPSAQKWSRSAHHRDSCDLGPSTSQ